MIIPHRMLSPEALRGVIEAFVTREGTDYGVQDVPLATKVLQVRQHLDAGMGHRQPRRADGRLFSRADGHHQFPRNEARADPGKRRAGRDAGRTREPDAFAGADAGIRGTVNRDQRMKSEG